VLIGAEAKLGRISAPRFPQRPRMNLGFRSEILTPPAHLIAMRVPGFAGSNPLAPISPKKVELALAR
jgi:hypothetical protein